MDETELLVRKLEADGCPSCKAIIALVEGILVGARPSIEGERFDGPALIVCLACGNGVRMVGPNQLPHRARRLV